MLIKRHVLQIVETNHPIRPKNKGGLETVGEMLDEMISHHVAQEERLARVVLEFSKEDWDNITELDTTPEIKNRYNSDLIRSAYDDNDDDSE